MRTAPELEPELPATAFGGDPGGDVAKLRDVCRGEHHETPYGPALVIDTHFPVSSNHGSWRVGALFDRPSSVLGELESLLGDPRLAGFDPRRTVYLDIEASGLRHGAGTYAFLIGLGYLEGDFFVVRQFLLEDLGSEQAALHLLVEHLDRFDYLASFNGKSYDLTVLISRLIMHRFYTQRECNLKLRPHLDLLHLSRNLYRGCWADTKLQTLEREALGFERVGDVPGSLVPTCWYHYLRTGDARPVAEVARHNLYDVLSMVTLTERLAVDAVDAPVWHEGVPGATEQRARSLVNLGGLLLRRRRPGAALACLQEALERLDPEDSFVSRALPKAVVAARRGGELDAQGALITRWCQHAPDSGDAWTAAAIYEERVQRDWRSALFAAYRVQAIAPSEPATRRIERLQRRLGSTKETRKARGV